jgi:hypothetical protein
MMTATSKMSMTAFPDICGHSAENCVTGGPFQTLNPDSLGIKLIVMQGRAISTSME